MRKSKGKPPIPKPAAAGAEQSRDIYGFTVRPQHVEHYKEYVSIYLEEEAERSDRWDEFLALHEDPAAQHDNHSHHRRFSAAETLSQSSAVLEDDAGPSSSTEPSTAVSADNAGSPSPSPYLSRSPVSRQFEGPSTEIPGKTLARSASWNGRRSLWPVERALSFRVSPNRENKPSTLAPADAPIQTNADDTATETDNGSEDNDTEGKINAAVEETKVSSDPPTEETSRSNGKHEEEAAGLTSAVAEDAAAPPSSKDPGPPPLSPKSQLVSRTVTRRRGTSVDFGKVPYDQELKFLVRGGVPMSLRGQLWQIFAGTKGLMVPGKYKALLAILDSVGKEVEGSSSAMVASDANKETTASSEGPRERTNQEKWTIQIEKDLPRTFPGHPALDQDGRGALRRLLTAYARHNPTVGYCQGMNFLAALLLLLMPEENAFWTLAAIIDHYLEGYYSEQMIEAQVDQLVFDELVRKHFPTVVAHLDSLGVQIAWMSGPWFLSVFVNILPWETVLRVWDVMLFEGNRSMLLRTAMALMDMNAHALTATKDAGDAVAMLQSMAAATFDSSQLVLTACMGFHAIDQPTLEAIREAYRPGVVEKVAERQRELQAAKAANGGKYVSRKKKENGEEPSSPTSPGSESGHQRFRSDGEIDGPDFAEQVIWLKGELSRALDEQQTRVARERELEAALMELAQGDNRRLLSAKVESLQTQVETLQAQVKEKEQQSNSMVEVMVRMQQEQAETERLRVEAEMNSYAANRQREQALKDAEAQRTVAEILQEKYETLNEKFDSLQEKYDKLQDDYNALLKEKGQLAATAADMQQRATLAESMLDVAAQAARQSNNNGANNANNSNNISPSPKANPPAPLAAPARGWRLSASLSGSFGSSLSPVLKGRSGP